MKTIICVMISMVATLTLAQTQTGAAAQTSLVVKFLDVSPKNAGQLDKLAMYPNLEKLKISCLENLKALPENIGTLSHLVEIKIDNGNGCSMNPKIPDSIGNLVQLRTLILAGAQDIRTDDPKKFLPRQPLPTTMANLINLEVLDLSRNGYTEVPAIVQKLTGLKTLKLNFNSLKSLPAWLNNLQDLKVISVGDNCAISGSEAAHKKLAKRFPRFKFDFNNEYDCD